MYEQRNPVPENSNTLINVDDTFNQCSVDGCNGRRFVYNGQKWPVCSKACMEVWKRNRESQK